MQQSILQKAGLTQTQIEVYIWLLENGKTKASAIAKNIKRPRGVAYKALEELLELNIIEKIEKNSKVALFQPLHPSTLEKIFEENAKKVQRSQQEFTSALPDLISQYNLSSQKPGIRFYEGEEGVIKSLADTLKSKTEIYTYSDIYNANDVGKKINNDYVAKRIKAQINKKVLAPISNKDLFPKEKQPFTEVRFLDDAINPFVTAMQIYDNKISYQTFDQDNMIAVIIEDKNIYSLHKGFFEFVWNNLTSKN